MRTKCIEAMMFASVCVATSWAQANEKVLFSFNQADETFLTPA